MSTQIMNIGAVPPEESCAQVGAPDYAERSHRECRIYRRMLERLFPCPAGVAVGLTVKSFPHDFDTYREVCVRYDDDDRRALDYALQVEREGPAHWDAVARYELAWLERLEHLQRAVRCGAMQPGELPPAYRSGEFPVLPDGQSFTQLLAAFPL